MTNSEYIRLPDYLALLQAHNWQYHQSHSVADRRSGLESEARLTACAALSQPRRALYCAFKASHSCNLEESA
jgi:hypothetical protein